MENKKHKTINNFIWIKIILIVAASFGSMIALSIAFNPGRDEYLKMRFVNLLSKIIFIIIALLFTKYLDKRDTKFLRINFEKGRSIKLFCIGCLVAVCQLLFINTTAYSFKFVEGGSFNFSWQVLFMGIFIYLIHCFFTGIGEEMIFRGYILGNLLTKYKRSHAVVISAIIFTAIHIGAHQGLLDYLDIFLMAVICAELFIETKSLYAPIGFHFIADFIEEEVFRNLEAAGNPYAVFKFTQNNSLIINGSNLGNKIELLFVLTEIVILLGIYIYKTRSQKSACPRISSFK